MTERTFILATIILSSLFIRGCIGKNEKQSIPSQESTKEVTLLISSTTFFCYWTELSAPFAYFQFAYQENGEVKYIKTKTTCDDLIKIGVTNNASEYPTLLGEQIRLHYKGQKPVRIVRENGEVYDVEKSEQISNFSASGINVYANLKYFKNSNSDKVVLECLLIKDTDQRDGCLSFQAACQQDIGICDKIIDSSNKAVCRQWVNNIKESSINK